MAEYTIHSGESINKYNAQLVSGDIINVEAGVYGGVSPEVSGVTYNSLEPLGAKTGEWYFSAGVSNVILDGFEIIDNGPLHENANCDNIMRNCWIHDAYMGWDVTQGSHRNVTENCKFERCVYAFHTSGTNNTGNIIRNCEIYDCIDDGINVSPVATDTQIINNIVVNSGDNGIHCFGAGSIVKGNLVYGSKGIGLWVAGGNSIVENNTVIGKGGTVYNILFWLEKSGNRVYNNIFYVDDPNEVLFFNQGSGDIDYNCWYNPQNPMTPIGIHGIAVDPKFVDPNNNDYTLQTESPCIGTGEGGIDMGYTSETGEPPEPPPEPPEPPESVTEVKINMTTGSGAISGAITDVNGTPIPGEGFALSNLPAGTYTITCIIRGTEIGYRYSIQSITVGA